MRFTVLMHWCHLRQNYLLLNCKTSSGKNLCHNIGFLFSNIIIVQNWIFLVIHVFVFMTRELVEKVLPGLIFVKTGERIFSGIYLLFETVWEKSKHKHLFPKKLFFPLCMKPKNVGRWHHCLFLVKTFSCL